MKNLLSLSALVALILTNSTVAGGHPKDFAIEVYRAALSAPTSALSAEVIALKAQNLRPSMEIGVVFNGGQCTASLECTFRYTVSTDFYKIEGQISAFKSLQAEIESNYHGNAKILNVITKD